MPLPYQIIPEGSLYRPKQVTYINDNTEVVTTYEEGGGSDSAVLCVFASPKGRDNVIQTIKNGAAEFMEKYGLGPFALYGQPLLNAYAAANAATTSNGMVHCLRVMPENATYSTATLFAKYKVTDGVMNVGFEVVPNQSDAGLTNLEDLPDVCTQAAGATGAIPMEANDAGWTPVRLFTLACNGRGEYGRNFRFRITTDKTTDKENNYKNYNFTIYRNENVLEVAENFNVTFVPDSLYGGKSLFAEDVINDYDTGSEYVKMYVDVEGFQTLYDAFAALYGSDPTACPFTINDFDPLLGIDKYTRGGYTNTAGDPNYVIYPADGAGGPGPDATTGSTPVSLSATTGIGLLGGSDGDLATTNANRQTVLNTLYKKAFAGEIDENIKSKNRYPTTFIYDANYPVETKLTLASLVLQRGDCVGVLDGGTELYTKSSVKPWFVDNLQGKIDDYKITFEPYAEKVRDPYSKKTVTVTGTYWLIDKYMRSIHENEGKHRPVAGNTYGIITGGIANSVYPIFDEDLDSTLMDELAELHCNIAKYNQNQQVVRSMQGTMQSRMTNLSELNNVLILLDIKRDCESLCARYEYDFAEPTDIQRFNSQVSVIADKYAAAQVRSISAHFDKSTWESERNIIHLYVEMIHKDLVKTSIIEIDVNRSPAEA